LPVLGNYLLDATDGKLTVSATNLEIGIACTIDATVDTPGRVTLQARVLNEFISSLPAGDVELRQDKNPLTIQVDSGNSKAHLRGIDPEEFPPLSTTTTGGATLRVDPAAFRDAISQVVFAAAGDDSRPVLAGVQLDVRESTISMAAADGFRMSLRSMSIDPPVETPFAVIVPARAMNELHRVLGDVTEPIDVRITPNASQVIVTATGLTFVSRLIDGAFPDLRQVVPKTWNTRTVVLREQLLDATRRATIFARSNNDVVKLEMNPAGDDLDMVRVTITANAADTGDNQDDVDAQVEGEGMQVAFNGRYLHDVLSVMRGPSISLELQGPNSAGVIRPVDSDDFTHVIMPMVIGS